MTDPSRALLQAASGVSKLEAAEVQKAGSAALDDQHVPVALPFDPKSFIREQLLRTGSAKYIDAIFTNINWETVAQ